MSNSPPAQKRAIIELTLGFGALEKSTIDQNPCTIGFKGEAGSGDALGGAVEAEAKGHWGVQRKKSETLVVSVSFASRDSVDAMTGREKGEYGVSSAWNAAAGIRPVVCLTPLPWIVERSFFAFR